MVRVPAQPMPWTELLPSQYAQHAAFLLERHSRAPFDSLAQSVPSLAHRDLLRRENAADRISGILGVSLERALESLAILEVDLRD